VSEPQSALYLGEVVHKRLVPKRHELRYCVYNLFVDVDELEDLSNRLPVFSYNRFNLLSIADRDHGPGDGTPIGKNLERLARTVAGGDAVTRFFMFCYPRVLGYVFNPLTVYYGYDSAGKLKLTIYEVNNTFGGRKSYVIPVGGKLQQRARKALYVSPFNAVEGSYAFHLSEPGPRLSLGILLTTALGPTMKAYFAGERRALTNANLWRVFLGLPLQSLKVIGAIHWQALKLWAKGLRIVSRPKEKSPVIQEQQDFT
jgi:hypothetical protein